MTTRSLGLGLFLLGGCAAAPAGGIDLLAGAPSRLAFQVPPTTGSSGGALAPAIRVAVVDPHGDPLAGAHAYVHLQLADNPVGGALAGSLEAGTEDGTAVFAEVAIERAGSYTLLATAAGLEPATSGWFVVTAGAPARLRFLDSPSGGAANAPMAESRIEIDDAAGNRVAGADNLVTLSLSANSGGALLYGTLSATPSHGVATFNGFGVDKPGLALSLAAASSGISGATSTPFDVN